MVSFEIILIYIIRLHFQFISLFSAFHHLTKRNVVTQFGFISLVQSFIPRLMDSFTNFFKDDDEKSPQKLVEAVNRKEKGDMLKNKYLIRNRAMTPNANISYQPISRK